MQTGGKLANYLRILFLVNNIKRMLIKKLAKALEIEFR